MNEDNRSRDDQIDKKVEEEKAEEGEQEFKEEAEGEAKQEFKEEAQEEAKEQVQEQAEEEVKEQAAQAPDEEYSSEIISKPDPKTKPSPPERIAYIQFRPTGKVYLYDANNLELDKGDQVIVETERGLGFARIVVAPRPYAGEREPEDGFRRIVRRANKKDLLHHEKNLAKELEAYEYCKKKIEGDGLEMKLIDVVFLHSGGKGIFSFSSEERVDFRDLVKDLAHKFHTRIEMRQIGIRDECKMIGGVGHCGRQLCCASWVREFQPVSIKMAKDQNLSLNPVKVSGVCGRLLCCLGYEAENYKELTKCMPRIGRRIETPKGPGEVMNIDVFKRIVSVHLDDGGYAKFSQCEINGCRGKAKE